MDRGPHPAPFEEKKSLWKLILAQFEDLFLGRCTGIHGEFVVGTISFWSLWPTTKVAVPHAIRLELRVLPPQLNVFSQLYRQRCVKMHPRYVVCLFAWSASTGLCVDTCELLHLAIDRSTALGLRYVASFRADAIHDYFSHCSDFLLAASPSS